MATTQATPEKSTGLPSPAERPDADVVIFDGQCKICTAQIERLARFDGAQRLAYISLHDPQVAERYPDLSYDEMMAAMYVVDRQGQRHRGADAVRYLSRRLPRLWWLAPLMHIPFSMPLWRWMYTQVANRRYRFGRIEENCDGGTCHLHGHS